jgi:hypothetical protein
MVIITKKILRSNSMGTEFTNLVNADDSGEIKTMGDVRKFFEDYQKKETK